MSLDPLKSDSAMLQQSGPTQALPDHGRNPSEDPGAATAIQSDQILLSARPGSSFHELQRKHDQQNRVAGAIRNTDRAAQAIGQKIDALKGPLETIVKNFPPFSEQDKERMKLLRSYSSLRKEIDRLTLPPPPDVIKARQAEALPPALPMHADDSQIADHLSKLDATAASLNELRRDLAAETASLLHEERVPGLFSPPKNGENGSSGASLTESAALEKSAEVGRQFAISVTQGVTLEHSQYLKRLS